MAEHDKLAAAMAAGVLDAAGEDHLADFHSGLRQLLDDVAARMDERG